MAPHCGVSVARCRIHVFNERKNFIAYVLINVIFSTSNVTYGNSDTELCDCYLTTNVTIPEDSTSHVFKFLIISDSNPAVIIGRPGLQTLGYSLSQNRSHLPFIEEITTKEGSLQLRARHFQMENAFVEPFHESMRKRSVTDHRIIYEKLEIMESQNQVKKVPVQNCVCILEVVLIDKQKDTRVYPAPDIDSRYRLTLDLRPINKMTPVVSKDTLHLLPQSISNDETNSNYYKQFQLGALDILKNTKILGAKYFAKVDLSNAFNSVAIHPDLGRLMNTQAFDKNGNVVYFQWQCLPQGFRLSPLLFSYCMSYLLKKLQLATACCIHYQDDILLGGVDEFETTKILQTLLHLLNKYQFKVNEKKVTLPTNRIHFCGYVIEHNKITPKPKDAVEDSAITSIWNQLLTYKNNNDQEAITTWLRSQAGRFQYGSNWYPPNGQILLTEFYNYLKLVQQPTFKCIDLSDDVLNQIHNHFLQLHELSKFKNNVLNFEHMDPQKHVATIILTDSNKRAWAGYVYWIRKIQEDEQNQTSTIDSGLWEGIKNVIPNNIKPTEVVLLPIRYLGSKWSISDTRKSSTHLERTAQLLAVYKSKEVLLSPVILVNDNQNAAKTWHNIEQYFGADELMMLQFMHSHVQHHIWIRRTSTLSLLVDETARAIENNSILVRNNAITSRSREGRNGNTLAIANNVTTSEVIQENNIDYMEIFEGGLKKFSMDDEIVNAIISATKTDDNTKYCGVAIKDIYNFLVSRESDTTRGIFNLSRKFHLQDNGLLSYGGQCARLYIPKGKLLYKSISDHEIQLRTILLYQTHDMLGHIGVGKTCKRLQRYYFWPTLISDVNRYIKSCCKCCYHKPPDNSGTLGSTIIGNKPYEVVVIDFAVYQSRDILVAVCTYSNHVTLCECKNQTATEVANNLWRNIICKYNFPTILHSDNGSSFMNETISELTRFINASQLRVHPYSPRTQGIVERMVQTMKKLLSGLELNEDFSNQLSFVEFIINTNETAINTIPYEVVFQRPCPDITTWQFSNQQFTKWPVAELHDLLITARRELQNKTKDSFITAATHAFCVGDRVIRFIRKMKPGGYTNIANPEGILVLEEEYAPGQWIAKEFENPTIMHRVPEYQLKRVDIADDLRAGLAEKPPPVLLFEPLQVNEIAIAEIIENEEWSYGVYRILEIRENDITARKFWWTGESEKVKWDEWLTDPTIETLQKSKIIANRIHLYNGKLSRKVMDCLETKRKI